MSHDAEAIEKIEALTKDAHAIQQLAIGPRLYVDKELREIKPPVDAVVQVSTLTGFSDMVAAMKPDPGKWFIAVGSPGHAMLSSLACDGWGRRGVAVRCELPPYGAFSFGQYLDQERFHIGLQSFFEQSPEDMKYLYQVAGNLTAEQVNTSVDNGLSQTVALRMGAVLAQKLEVKRILKLKPWRTFREIEQPEGSFIFRLKNMENAVPSLALFVGDGEKWQLDAVQSIKTWLQGRHPSLNIVA